LTEPGEEGSLRVETLDPERCVKLTKEQVMVSKAMKGPGTSVRQLAKQLGVTEGALRYRLRVEGDRSDGRANQATALIGMLPRS
jgi:hypothetical protein